ncbi:16S rRNA (cytidine(1402)-2'-O)-methyltransferase [Ornithinibacillus gellani]|uniref:16S rRNA (cytidine(1402)-2'-O)-methyltransferase n=1 Tax=Ornithinibacillus gellani TaxID=2293253 RepID=UPI000F49C992|nr:16S rRNA (cytidine(1402)-2'-O)-methyltransferase [Ornithinibacillus gellani]TQS75355.1 16S rRNA (cytidine(1402)-2'-O)-methyltransferase [Ornithinibacillus gellani]
MKIQKSFSSSETGTLYVVPTPIGNLEDITYRALKILESVAVIAAEDTRNTKKLLLHFEISVPLISYHEHNKLSREEQLLARLANGESVAIVSDAGMPAISDPGYELVQAAIEVDYPVVVLPGANAALCALVGSGLATDEFLFYGFLPRKKKSRVEALERLRQAKATLLFYESPHRIRETLQTINEVLGNRKIAIARELTKRFEEYIRGEMEEICTWAADQEWRGELCIVVEGSQETELASDEKWWETFSLKGHVEHYMQTENISSKEAIRLAAKDRALPKRDVYQAYHIDKE